MSNGVWALSPPYWPSSRSYHSTSFSNFLWRFENALVFVPAEIGWLCLCFYVLTAFHNLPPFPINDEKTPKHLRASSTSFLTPSYFHILPHMGPSVTGNAVVWDDFYSPPVNGQSIGPSKSSIYNRQKVRSITPRSQNFSRTEPISEEYVPRKRGKKSKVLTLEHTT